MMLKLHKNYLDNVIKMPSIYKVTKINKTNFTYLKLLVLAFVSSALKSLLLYAQPHIGEFFALFFIIFLSLYKQLETIFTLMLSYAATKIQGVDT